MPWQLAFAAATLMGIVRILYQRRYALSSNIPATIPPAVSYLFGVLPVGLIAGFLIFPHHINFSWWMVVLMLVLSASMTISNWLGFITARRLAIAPQQTIGMLTDIVTVLLGWTLLGEGLTVTQFVGGGILLVAAYVAIRAPVRSNTGGYKKLSTETIWIAVLAATLLAVGLVTEKALLGHMDIGGIFLVSWPVQTLGMLLLAARYCSRDVLRTLKGRELRASTLLGLSNGLNGVLYIYAIFHSDNISLISVLGSISLPLMVLGAYIFLREREHHKLMWLSLAISFIGLVVMAIRV